MSVRAALPPFSSLANSLQRGLYEHYSGKRYHLLGVGRDSENLQEVAVYQAESDGEIWVRPLEMFCGNVWIDGVKQPRFCLKKFLRDDDAVRAEASSL